MSNNPLDREILAENYRHPQNTGKPERFTHRHDLANRTCGDEISVYLHVTSDTLQKINYEARACALCIASASILSQELVNMPLEELAKWEETDVEKLLDSQLSISRVKCALLPLRAIQQALGLRPPAAEF